jgi:tRNA dimethylallyltransferase
MISSGGQYVRILIINDVIITTNILKNNKYITILGPTASGKSSLALDLAEAFNGEIICADSRTIYRHMDIGTAKPTREEQSTIQHHLLDLIDPDQRLSAADFQQRALKEISSIQSRGRIPFLVGGSGLYIDSVIYDYTFPLEALSDDKLREKLLNQDQELYKITDTSNRRRVIRALETVGLPRIKRNTVTPNTFIIGLTMSKIVAQKRIEARINKMLSEGFIDEVSNIGIRYGWDSEAMNIIGYKAFKDVVRGTKSIAQGTSDFVAGDMALYKKQITWFKRNTEIHWIADLSEAMVLLRAFLAE